MLFGFAKAAIMPLHSWLPAAMVAPTPVSALLHAVVVVKVGVFSVCRMMLSLFGTEQLAALDLGIATAWIAAFTILTASIIAMTKTDLKARLAYSTVSQLSYIVLGVAMLVPERDYGRAYSYRQPRICKDKPVLLRRGHHLRNRQNRHPRYGRPRAADAA